MTIRNLLISLLFLIVVFLCIVLFSPKIGEKVKPVDDSSLRGNDIPFVPEEDSAPDVPENYVLVAGYEDVYKVINDGTVEKYMKRLKDGEFIDYDINMPVNYSILDESMNIYKVLDEKGNILNYRRFNGKEWDIVDKEGNILFEIPDDYKRADNTNELYYTKDKNKEYWKKLIKFDDGSYAWETIDKKDLSKK